MARDLARNTKEDILRVALLMFAESGFAGVSMREIAAQVGIRESSLYRHYPSKQALFQSTLMEMARRCQVVAVPLGLPQGDAAPAADACCAQGFSVLRKGCRSMLLFYRQDACAAAYFRLLTGEQFRGGPASQVYHEEMLEVPLAYYRDLFSLLMERGVLRGRDAEALALEFYAPILFLFSRCADRPDAELLTALERHLDQFESAYSLM